MKSVLPDFAEVIVVGGGPAGLAAATLLRRQGVASVLVIEREANAGGIPRHCGHFPYGLREFNQLMRGPQYAARLVSDAVAAGVDIRTGVTVLSLHDGPSVTITSDAGVAQVGASRIILAMGVRETSRAARSIGGTKPRGVLSTGALQGLVYLEGLRPFRRPIILGTELVAMSAILTCRHLGIRPAAMVESGPRATARWPAGMFPRLCGIPLMLNTQLEAIEGDASVSGVLLRGPDGVSRHIDADGVIVTGGFRPEAALLAGSDLAVDVGTRGPQVDSFGRCSAPAFFAAGNLLRAVETAGVCWAEGRAVARAVLRSLKGELPKPASCGRVKLRGDAFAYVMPQQVSTTQDAPAFPTLQLRLNRAARGRLVCTRDGVTLSSQRINSLPERRINVPLPPAAGDLTITLESSD
jgi:thioredoxin reductase